MVSVYLYAAGGGVLLAVLAAAAAIWYYRRYRQTLDDRLEQILADTDDVVEFEPPEVKSGPLDYFRVMRHLQRQKKLAKKGYVKWYRLGSTLSRPQWVEPTADGAGTPSYRHDGQPYYFPKEAMVSDSMTGAYVAVHREGEGDPINLRDPAYPGIDTDLVERIINLEAEDEPRSGLLSGFDGLSTQALMYGGIALMFGVYAVYMYSTGALG